MTASGGRPTKLTPALQKQYVAALKRLHYFETAAAAVGISCRTVQRWRKRGRRDPNGLHGEFCRAIKKALAEVESGWLKGVAQGGPRWQSLAWLLERRYPERWGTHAREIRQIRRELAELEQIIRPVQQGGQEHS
jgi:transposase